MIPDRSSLAASSSFSSFSSSGSQYPYGCCADQINGSIKALLQLPCARKTLKMKLQTQRRESKKRTTAHLTGVERANPQMHQGLNYADCSKFSSVSAASGRGVCSHRRSSSFPASHHGLSSFHYVSFLPLIVNDDVLLSTFPVLSNEQC